MALGRSWKVGLGSALYQKMYWATYAIKACQGGEEPQSRGGEKEVSKEKRGKCSKMHLKWTKVCMNAILS